MVGHSGVDMNNWVLMWSVVVGLIGITGCALCTLTFKVPGTGLAGGSLGHRMGGLFYLSRGDSRLTRVRRSFCDGRVACGAACFSTIVDVVAFVELLDDLGADWNSWKVSFVAFRWPEGCR